MREDKLARQMFYGGCAFLPWLWIVNVMYFRKAVYGPIPLVDYLPGGDRRQVALDRFADGSAYDEDEDGPIENMPQVGASGASGASDDTDAETDFGDGDDDGDGSNATDEGRLGARTVQRGVETWVKRSTLSATLVVGLFVVWIAVFQVHKDSFGPKWFVMKEEEGESTGW
mmetsp:Transcript_18054/g.51688  ORF Transcript_18054/g.51688 Transcript_18054/m.51688 type:complete len:171 (+) Transcript_18054:92-604(+)